MHHAHLRVSRRCDHAVERRHARRPVGQLPGVTTWSTTAWIPMWCLESRHRSASRMRCWRSPAWRSPLIWKICSIRPPASMPTPTTTGATGNGPRRSSCSIPTVRADSRSTRGCASAAATAAAAAIPNMPFACSFAASMATPAWTFPCSATRVCSRSRSWTCARHRTTRGASAAIPATRSSKTCSRGRRSATWDSRTRAVAGTTCT